jgi:hypothetical protein
LLQGVVAGCSQPGTFPQEGHQVTKMELANASSKLQHGLPCFNASSKLQHGLPCSNLLAAMLHLIHDAFIVPSLEHFFI